MTPLLLLVGVSLGAVANQHAVCSNTDFSWAFNSLKQSPCQIGEALGNQCSPHANFRLDPVPTGWKYAGTTHPNLDCVCNTVFYSILNLCAACQGAGVFPFQRWSQDCSVTFNSYPNAIPKDTAVPHYAYLPLLNGSFDFNAALADHGAETMAGTGAVSSSKKPSNVWPIAGGVVAGLIALGLTATGIFFFLKRRKRNAASLEPGVMDVDDDGEDVVHPYCYQQLGMAQRVYDSNDASPFPVSTQASTTPPPYTSIAERTTRAHKPSVRP